MNTARKLSEPGREAPGPKLHLKECPLEECPKQRRTDCAETDALQAEPCERPEEPDFDAPDFDADEDLGDDLDEQSLADLIASIRHDTGLATLSDAELWQRRPPPNAQGSAQESVPSEMYGLCAHRAAIPQKEHQREHPRSGRKAAGLTSAPPRITQSTPGTPRPGTGPPAP